MPTHDADAAREIARHLVAIQQSTREYVVQPEAARKMTFASIRIAADAVATAADDDLAGGVADDVREQVNAIQAAVDDLADRYGSDEPGHCRVCGRRLETAALSGADQLSYCTHCPTPLLDAVREISDLTGADTL